MSTWLVAYATGVKMTKPFHRPRGHLVIVENDLRLHNNFIRWRVAGTHAATCTTSTRASAHIASTKVTWLDDSEDTLAITWRYIHVGIDVEVTHVLTWRACNVTPRIQWPVSNDMAWQPRRIMTWSGRNGVARHVISLRHVWPSGLWLSYMTT